MKNVWLRLAGLALGLALVVSCSFRDQGLAPLIPADALGFAQITDTETFIKNADGFMEPLGVTAMTGNMGLKDLLTLGLKAGANLDLAAIDLKKPLGIAVMPPPAGKEEPGLIIYVPFTKPEESGPKLEKLLAGMGPEVKFTKANGYAIYTIGTEQASFPPAKSLSIPESLVFVPGSITLYGDVQNALGRYGQEWTKLKQETADEILSSEASISQSSQAMSKSMIEGMFSAIAETRSVAINIALDTRGITSTSTAEFKPDGEVAKLLKAMGPGKGLSSQTRYLPADFLASGAGSGNWNALSELYLSWMDVYFDALELSDADKTAFRGLMADSMKLSGQNLAWAFDLDFDPAIIAEGEEAVLANLDTAFNLKLLMVQELSDVNAYQKYLKDVLEGDLLKKYLDASLSDTGFSMDFKLEEKKDGDFAYQALNFNLQVADPDKLAGTSEEARVAAAAAASILGKLSFSMATKGNKLYMAMGSDTVEALKQLVAKDGVEKPISTISAWNDWSRTVPGDAQFSATVSVNRIVALVKKAVPGFAVELPEADRSGLKYWLKAGASNVTFSASADLKELTPIIKTAMQMGSSLFGSGSSGFEGESDYEGGDWSEEEGWGEEGEGAGDGEYFGDGPDEGAEG